MKNEKTKQLIENIHSRVKDFVNGSDYINYLKFIKKFRKRSFFNQMLIWITKENSTFVMGYKQWIDKFNRIPVACVICRALSNKECSCEERTPAVRIPQLAPITYKYEDKQGEEKDGIYFKTVYVFDISDTEPLPDLPIKEVFEDEFDLGIKKLDVEVQFEKLEPVLKKIITDNGFKFRYEVVNSESLGGWTNHALKEVVCKDNTNNADKLHTLLHEIGHMFAHSRENLNNKNFFRPRIETEAETIAFVVADYLGIDTSCYSIGYITSWSGGDDDILEDSVKAVVDTSNKMLDLIEIEIGDKVDIRST
jgi:hypothetical protein